MTTTAKPLLLIDVDGPLNAFGGPYSGNHAPDGYQQHRLRDQSFTDEAGRPWVQGGLRIWLNPAHGPMLLTLRDLVELTWATSWEHAANTLIAPIVGLPELPVIEFPRRPSYPFGQIFKRADVETYVGDRPFAWLDDDFEPGDFEWAKARSEGGAATLLLHIDPKVGIVQGDVDRVAGWAAAIRALEAAR